MFKSLLKKIQLKRYNSFFYSLLGRLKDKVCFYMGLHEIMILNLDNDSIFIKIQKVASSSLQETLKTKGERITKKELIKRKYSSIHVFVRNPYSRLFSAYYFCLDKGNKRGHILSDLKKYSKFHGDMTFKEFVHAVSSISDEDCDGHFAPQYIILTDNLGNLIPNNILKFENFNKSLETFCQKNNLDYKYLHLNSSKNQDWMDNYDEELIELVNKKYRKDFKLFKYEIIDPIQLKKIKSELKSNASSN